MAEQAQTAPAPVVAPVPVAPAGGKPFPMMLVVIVGAVVLCLIGAVVAYFVLISGADKKFDDAKDEVADIYEDYFDEAADETDEDASYQLFIDATTDAQSKMSLVMCFGIKDKSDKDDCDDLKTALSDAKTAAVAAKRIYDANQEDEQEDELADLEEDFTDALYDIVSICDISMF